MNVDVLHINGRGECLERIVVKTMQRGHQAQIFGHALRDRLGQSMILDGESNIAAEQLERVEFTIFVQRISGTAAKPYDSGKTASGFERSEAFEQLRRDISVRA